MSHDYRSELKLGQNKMGKAKKIFSHWRVILLLFFLVIALVAIHPKPGAEGIAIRSVTANSSANIAGIQSPKPTTNPMGREVILAINNKPIKNVDEYNAFIATLTPQSEFNMKTNQGVYRIIVKPLTQTTILPETEEKTVSEVIWKNETLNNGTTVLVNNTINKKMIVNKTKTEIIGMEDIGLTVYAAPKSNIRKGLDLQGGTRVLLQPEKMLSADDMSMLLENMKYRLNIYGLSDVIVREAGDLSGNQYVLVEIAGATNEEVKQLLAQQGKFEAKVGNTTVFLGGNDVVYVARSATEAGIDSNQGCGMFTENQWTCRFRFGITLSPEAANRQAAATQELEIITENGDEYLTEKLYLYLDDELVDELNIGAELRGRAETNIAISGSGIGLTKEEAVYDALANMKKLQTILITGSLPVKLNVVKIDAISPMLGEEFIKNAFLVGALAILAVSVVVFFRYKRWDVSVPMILSMLSEVVLLLGFAAIVGWNLDLAAIAGIIVSIGTGVDHLVVIADETVAKSREILSFKEKLKRAFFIIMGAYLTVLVAMIPLWFAGAGLLKGFAITTIAGVSFGVFIARPAFAAILETILKEE